MIEEWQRPEIAKLPVIHGKAGDYPDPMNVRRVKLEAMSKHLMIVDRELQTSINKWKTDVEQEKRQYGKFAQDLESIHYGDDAANGVCRNAIANTQNKMLHSLQTLLDRSNTIWNNALDWYKKKIAVDN